MKKVILVMLAILCGREMHASRPCPEPETIDRLQELQRCVGSIKSIVTTNQTDNIIIESLSETIIADLSVVEQVLCSKIDNITIDTSGLDVQCSGIDELSVQLSEVEQLLCSKIEDVFSDIEDLSVQLSDVEQVLCSKIDNITIDTSGLDVQCSGIDELSVQLSETDAMLCSKIGMLDGEGSCLESVIDVPDDINNLDLSTIQLLKTILLNLYGCGMG